MASQLAQLIEAYSHRPRSPRTMQSHAKAVLRMADDEGVFDRPGLYSRIAKWARKHNVSMTELAQFVFRQGRRDDYF